MNILTNMPTGVAAVFWGVITFSLLVLLHEGGHYLAARAFGVKVHEYMLGLPGPALRWRSKRSGTAFGVTAIPLGGYVRIAGMEPGPEDPLLAEAIGLLADQGHLTTAELARGLGVDTDRAVTLLATLEDYAAVETVKDEPAPRTLVRREAGESDDALLTRVRSHVFRGLPTWKRITVLAMGVLVNLVAAILILAVTFSIWGTPTGVSRTVQVVQAGSAAARAGILAGDTVLAIGPSRVTAWSQVLAFLKTKKPGDVVAVSVSRGGRTLVLTAALGARPDGTAFLGVGPQAIYTPMPPLTALGTSLRWTGLVFAAVAQFFDPKTFSTSITNARSIVGASYEVANAAQDGPLPYAWLFALLSLSLGVVNVVPIPPLDGGKIAVEVIERIARRPLPRRLTLVLSGVGTALLLSLIFYLMYADILRYVFNRG
jgi:regulator of sigma E protease